MFMIDVAGNCPMGCGKTLHFNSDSGMISCLSKRCPSPLAVTTLLAADAPFHTVKIARTGWAVEHPLAERVTGSLFDCALTDWLTGLDRPPVSAGIYRVERTNEDNDDDQVVDGWHFEEIEESN